MQRRELWLVAVLLVAVMVLEDVAASRGDGSSSNASSAAYLPPLTTPEVGAHTAQAATHKQQHHHDGAAARIESGAARVENSQRNFLVTSNRPLLMVLVADAVAYPIRSAQMCLLLALVALVMWSALRWYCDRYDDHDIGPLPPEPHLHELHEADEAAELDPECECLRDELREEGVWQDEAVDEDCHGVGEASDHTQRQTSREG